MISLLATASAWSQPIPSAFCHVFPILQAKVAELNELDLWDFHSLSYGIAPIFVDGRSVFGYNVGFGFSIRSISQPHSVKNFLPLPCSNFTTMKSMKIWHKWKFGPVFQELQQLQLPIPVKLAAPTLAPPATLMHSNLAECYHNGKGVAIFKSTKVIILLKTSWECI